MAILEQAVLAVLLVGSTHYIDIGQGKDAAIYYESDSKVHMALPAGPVMHGQWSLQPDGWYVKWTGGPEGRWQIQHEPGAFIYLDGKGARAGTVTSVVPGDAAKLAQ
jgi:hypothetical protein